MARRPRKLDSRTFIKMAKYTSPAQTIGCPAEEIVAKFSDFRKLQTKLDELPESERSRVGDVSFTEDAIIINTPQVGQVKLRAVERTPQKITLQAENSPVPMAINVIFKPLTPSSTEVYGEMDVDIPVMLRPLVGPALQKAVDQFGNLFARLS